MKIAMPQESVYYYECSYGKFRLTYFIPFEKMMSLVDTGEMASMALKDFPDGADLDCELKDYADFKKHYGYYPKYEPGEIRRAFFAILSSTKNWRNYYGTGFISAAEIESRIVNVEEALSKEKFMEKRVEPPTKKLPVRKMRSLRNRLAMVNRHARKFLKDYKVKGVNKNYSFAQQEFSKLEMVGDLKANSVFVKLHQKQTRKG